MAAACELVRFALLHDGRCLSAEPGVANCTVSLKPCSAAEPLQAWRLEESTAGVVVRSPAKEAEWARHDAGCEDSSVDCAAWAAAGECRRNPAYMHSHCLRSCARCRPKAACSIWAHRPPPRHQADGDPSVISSTAIAPMLGLASNSSRRARLAHMHVQLANWSSMYPVLRLVRAACPGLPQAACCLESGLWRLGAHNSRVKYALWHLCSYHEAHMFPYRARRAAPRAARAACIPAVARAPGVRPKGAERARSARTARSASWAVAIPAPDWCVGLPRARAPRVCLWRARR